MSDETLAFTYHTLLIGIDRYPPQYNSLYGCVNDIEAIEDVLLGSPGVGVAPEKIRLTRLAAPHPNHHSTSRYADTTKAPTKTNVVDALKDLAQSEFGGSDRVLIYYAGHGDEIRPDSGTVWHEALVPCDENDIEYLFDVEVNLLIGAIAAKVDDLTVVLDCCHSAGATRDFVGIEPEGSYRALQHSPPHVDPPDLSALGLGSGAGSSRAVSSGLLRSGAAEYLVVAACQADQKAGEGAYPAGQPRHGVLTQSLLSTLQGKNAEERARLRWADIWPTLLKTVAERNAHFNQRPQHPWVIGRSERKIFGGSWKQMDAGYPISLRPNGEFTIGAGTLSGVTEGAEIAVYGSRPLHFKPIGSEQDRPVGRLKVTKADKAESIGLPVDGEFTLPKGARGRLVKTGQSERLRVSVKPEGAAIPQLVRDSPLLEFVPAADPHPDVEIIAQADGSWVIGSDVEPVLAVVEPENSAALRSGLEHCYRSSALLRFAQNCNDPEVSRWLDVQILDCNDEAKLQSMSPKQLAEPDLPEAPRDDEGNYLIPASFRFCFRVTNNSPHQLDVTLMNASPGGLVENLSHGTLRRGASEAMWLDGNLGEVFVAALDKLPDVPGIPRSSYVTERTVVTGTSRRGVDLSYLAVDQRVQEVVDEYSVTRGGDQRPLRPAKEEIGPAEFWTATVVPVRVER